MASRNTDNCTLFPEGAQSSCCAAHDMAYMFGASREKADRELRECVIASGRPATAWVMWAGVRTFGWFFWWRAKRHVKKVRSSVKT